MKKKSLIIGVLFCILNTLLIFASTNEVSEKTDISLTINYEDILIPAREISEKLGFNVDWDNKNNCIRIFNANNYYVAFVNSSNYVINGETITLPQSTVIVDDIVYIPLSFAEIVFNDFLNPVLYSIPEDVEDTILQTVSVTIQSLKEEQIKANEEYKHAFLSTGGDVQKYVEPNYYVGFEVLSATPSYISIMIYKYQSLASSYTEEVYYTFDTNTGELVYLTDLVGGKEDYVKQFIIDEALLREQSTDYHYSYFHDKLEDISIDENTLFYINEDNQLVIVFPKYSISAGVYGKQEFIIKNI